jgi:hypothetical protein
MYWRAPTAVHVLQYCKGAKLHKNYWRDSCGKESDIPIKDAIAWAELPQPFSLTAELAKPCLCDALYVLAAVGTSTGFATRSLMLPW